ncbi:amino acid adenylation domain-containing protein [Clostridium sp. D2Q-14]|uniref:amino acid adenylation domain-containing protein n=1 Tax=Anaeromonas gelatinilytica TaxID=2683194 RepID=UPI00193B91EE|nr:amino acid adenylation domain-containing protein [Anaeromonas gelatinilytica]
MIIEAFRKQVNKNKDGIAIDCEGTKISYGELELKSNWLANQLLDHNINANDIVAVVMDNSIHYIIYILAIMKIGGTFLPIDSSFPDAKIQTIINQSNCKNIITNNQNRMSQIFDCEILQFDCFEKLQVFECSKNLVTAYIIFTSGTTGSPKGVAISEKSFWTFLQSMRDVFDVENFEKVAFLTSISFDIHLVETIFPLVNGKTLLVTENKKQSHSDISKFLAINKVDFLQLTPSRLKLLLQDGKNTVFLKSLKYLLIGGEAFPKFLLKKVKKYTNAKIFNMYGPTEATIWVSCADLTDTNTISIGKAFSNSELYIEDNTHELLIAGNCLTDGYLGNLELTQKAFKTLEHRENKRYYRTGDVVKMTEDGDIQIIGRCDRQIKINGYRIELEEIEDTALQFNNKIRDAIVYFKKFDNSNIFDLYVVCQELIQVEYLQRFLKNRLPYYMVPQNIFVIDEIPLNSNGKVDHSKFEDLYKKRKKSSKKYEPVLTIIEKVTGVPIVKDVDGGKGDINLGSLSVDSINFVRIIIELENYYDIEFDTKMMDFKIYESFQELINYIDLAVQKKELTILDESFECSHMLDPNYEKLLGQGRFGIVYRASETEAIKFFHPIRDKNSLNAEIYKVKALSGKTPFTTTFIESGNINYNDQNVQYFKMQYIEGVTVEELIMSKKIDPYVLVTILCSIVGTLKVATSLGFGHHDITIRNIMISEDYEQIIRGKEYSVFLIDFGAHQDLNDCSGILDVINKISKKLKVENEESEEFVNFLNSVYIPLLSRYEKDISTDHEKVISDIYQTLLDHIPEKWDGLKSIRENRYKLPDSNNHILV